MPSLDDVNEKRPVMPQSGSLDDYQRQKAFWDLHIEPEVEALRKLISTKPQREDYKTYNDFYERWNVWMGRFAFAIGTRLTNLLKKWDKFLNE